MRNWKCYNKLLRRLSTPIVAVLLSVTFLFQAILPGLLSLAGTQPATQQFFVELCTSNGLELVAVDQPDAAQAKNETLTHDLQAHCPLCLIAADEGKAPELTPRTAGYYTVFSSSFLLLEAPFHHKHLAYLLPDVRGSPQLG